LAAINLIAIALIGLLYSTVEGSSEEKVPDYEKSPVKEAKVSFHDHFRAVVKEHKKKSELSSPFIISFLIAILIFFISFSTSSATQAMLLLAIIIGFVLFVIITLIFNHRFTKRFRALAGTKIYIILLICSIALTAYDYYHVHKEYNASIHDYIAQNFLGQEALPTDGYVFTGE